MLPDVMTEYNAHLAALLMHGFRPTATAGAEGLAELASKFGTSLKAGNQLGWDQILSEVVTEYELMYKAAPAFIGSEA